MLDEMSPREAWQKVAASKPCEAASSLVHPTAAGAELVSAGIGIWHSWGEFPGRLLDDPWAPAVLFYRGNASALSNPTVALIGTRNCTAEGNENAFQLGRELSEAGVSVVSGLALGIDGAAHRGALSVHGAPPIGVVGSGLNVVYPRRHGELWSSVASRGLLISEAPLHAPPERWRFPARNRIIAGLADVVVVVESNAKGGSLLTVKEAALRGVPVMAVPGSIRSRASVGANDLLRDGCAPACSTRDILEALDVELPAQDKVPGIAAPHAEDRPILAAVRRHPTSMEEVIAASGESVTQVASSLIRLLEGGWVTCDDGWWQKIGDETRGGNG